MISSGVGHGDSSHGVEVVEVVVRMDHQKNHTIHNNL